MMKEYHGQTNCYMILIAGGGGGGGEVHLTTCIIVIIMSCMLYHVHDKIDAGYNTAM